MGALVAFLLAAEMVHGERIDELVGNAHAGVQRGRRILEDDRDDTADFHALLRGAMRDVLPFEQHLPGRERLQSAHHVRRRRLAAAGLADDANRLARHELEIHAVDGGDPVAVEQARTRTGREHDLRVLQFDDRDVLVLMGFRQIDAFAHRAPSFPSRGSSAAVIVMSPISASAALAEFSSEAFSTLAGSWSMCSSARV